MQQLSTDLVLVLQHVVWQDRYPVGTERSLLLRVPADSTHPRKFDDSSGVLRILSGGLVNHDRPCLSGDGL